jgi:hypothetical protein
VPKFQGENLDEKKLAMNKMKKLAVRKGRCTSPQIALARAAAQNITLVLSILHD